MRYVDPRVALGLLYFTELPAHLRHAWFTPVLQPQAIHPHYSLIDADLMAWARGQGCAVNTWTVNEPAEARRLAAVGVDVIISDVVMPGMDGPTVVREARKTRPDLRILFMSGYAEEQLRREIDIDAMYFLPKPFSVQQISDKVAGVLRAKGR